MPFAFPTISGGGGSGGGSTHPIARKGYKAPDVHALMKQWGIAWGGVVPKSSGGSSSSGGAQGALQLSFPSTGIGAVYQPSGGSGGSSFSGSGGGSGGVVGGGSGGLVFALVAVAPVLVAYLLGRR